MKQNGRTGNLSRRQMLKVMGAGSAELLLPACSEQSEGPGVAVRRVPLRLVVMDYDENMKADTQSLIDDCNESQKEIEASLDVYSWPQGHDLLVTHLGGGQAPDLANVNSLWLSEWMGIDEISPLDELYDLEEDPWETRNLVPDPRQAARLEEQRAKLLHHMAATDDPFLRGVRTNLQNEQGRTRADA
jgi:ABC-type glycerol-3-phosphate transport system substrate-binding protein